MTQQQQNALFSISDAINDHCNVDLAKSVQERPLEWIHITRRNSSTFYIWAYCTYYVLDFMTPSSCRHFVILWSLNVPNGLFSYFSPISFNICLFLSFPFFNPFTYFRVCRFSSLRSWPIGPLPNAVFFVICFCISRPKVVLGCSIKTSHFSSLTLWFYNRNLVKIIVFGLLRLPANERKLRMYSI